MSSARQKEMLTLMLTLPEKGNGVFDSINRIDLPFSTYFNWKRALKTYLKLIKVAALWIFLTDIYRLIMLQKFVLNTMHHDCEMSKQTMAFYCNIITGSAGINKVEAYLKATGELHHLLCLDVLQTVHTSNAITNRQHTSSLLQVYFRWLTQNPVLQYGRNFSTFGTWILNSLS